MSFFWVTYLFAKNYRVALAEGVELTTNCLKASKDGIFFVQNANLLIILIKTRFSDLFTMISKSIFQMGNSKQKRLGANEFLLTKLFNLL